MTTRRVARVLIDSPLPQLDRLFDYAIPDELAADVQPGVRVQGAAAQCRARRRRVRRRAGRGRSGRPPALRARRGRLADPRADPGAVRARPTRRRPRRRIGHRHPAPGRSRSAWCAPRRRGWPPQPAAAPDVEDTARAWAERVLARLSRRSCECHRPRRSRSPSMRRPSPCASRTASRSGRGPRCSPPPRCARSAAGRSAILVVPDHRDQAAARGGPGRTGAGRCDRPRRRAAELRPRGTPRSCACSPPRRASSSAIAPRCTRRCMHSGSSRSGTTATRCSPSRSAPACTRATPL